MKIQPKYMEEETVEEKQKTTMEVFDGASTEVNFGADDSKVKTSSVEMDNPCEEETDVNKEINRARVEVEEKVSTEDRCVKLKEEEEEALLVSNVATAGEAEYKLKSLEQLHQQSLDSAAQNNLKLSLQLEEAEALNAQFSNEAGVLSAKICELESELSRSWELRNELEAQLNDSNERCADHESRANALHERNLELHQQSLDSAARNSLELSLQLEEAEALSTQVSNEARVLSAKVCELESELSDTWVLRNELEAQLKDLNERCAEHESRANALRDRNLELEDLVRSSLSKIGELGFILETQKSQITQLEHEREAMEQTASRDAEDRSRQHYELERAAEAAAERERVLETDKQRMSCQVQELEFALAQSLAELERCAGQETKIHAIYERNQELKDLVQSFQFKVADSERRLGEAEFLFESEKSRINELEGKCAHAEKISAQYENMMSSAANELEETVQKYREVEDQLNFVKSSYDDAERKLKERSLEVESVRDGMVFQVEQLQATIFELESALSQSLFVRSQLEAEMERVNEICGENEGRAIVAQERVLELEDLVRFWESRVEESDRREKGMVVLMETQESIIKDVEQRNVDTVSSALEAAVDNEKRLAESLEAIAMDKRILEQVLQDSIAKLEAEKLAQNHQLTAILEEKESEVSSLYDKLAESIEAIARDRRNLEQVLQDVMAKLEAENHVQNQELTAILEEKESEVNSLYEKLTESVEAIARDKRDLEKVLQDAMAKLEIQNLVQNQELTAIREEKESEVNSLYEKLVYERQVVEAQTARVHETMQELTYKELQVKELSENLEEQIKIHEIKNCELLESDESTRGELERCVAKLQDQQHVIQELEAKLGDMETQSVEENMGLESRLNHAQQKLCVALAEKEAAATNLQTSIEVTRDLEQELSSERQRFQTMVAAIMEEKQLLHDSYRDAQIELQRELKECKESSEGLRGEMEKQAAQNFVMQTRVNELEHLLLATGVMFEKQVEEKVLKSPEKVQEGIEELVSPLPNANEKLGQSPGEMKNSAEKKQQQKKKNGGKPSVEGPIRVAVGVGLVSVVAAILAGKK